MNRRLVVLLGIAALIGALALFDAGPDGAASDVVEAVERPATLATLAATAPVTRPAGPADPAEPAIARLIPRAELIGEEGDALGAGGAVFGSQNWNPPPPPPPSAATLAQNAAPPPEPSAPPLPFTYLGKANEAGIWEVYLARADKTYIVKHQSVIDGVYRVEAIRPPTLTLTYLPLNQVQTLQIGVLE